ncbi:hypothetical protein [Streptomyces sp. NPDC020597]|uniref:hypothetical protein n=1 Tax=unclassified Streptomyces TaxID=2593676 RepID=UPI0037954F84
MSLLGGDGPVTWAGASAVRRLAQAPATQVPARGSSAVEAALGLIAAMASPGRSGHVYAGGVTLVWVTGNSGAGKSTVCAALRERGHVALDADEDGFSRWIDRAEGEAVMDLPHPVPEGWLDRYGWVIVRERVETLVEESRFRIAFLCGSAENEAEVRDLFDVIVCLVIKEDTLRHRLATRTTNAFGRHPEELAAALEWNPRMRAIYEGLGATIIDASEPLTEVVDSVIDAAQKPILRRCLP